MKTYRQIAVLSLLLLGGCSATMHPDYQKVFYKQNVPPQQIEEVMRRFGSQGLPNAKVNIDALGRVQLSGSYENEKEVELAFSIARGVVGESAVSNVRPEIIKQKDWEISASKGFAKFIEELAKKFNMAVHVEQSGADNLIDVSNTGTDGLEQFATNSSEPTSKASQFYHRMAVEIANTASAKDRKKRILIVGHTDDIGDSRRNAVLSEQRARSVGKIFESEGIPSDRIYYQGAGESLPVADNRTEEGRSRNRRVEIVDVTDDKAFRTYLASRQPKIAYYRPATLPGSNTTSASTPITRQKANTARPVLPKGKGDATPTAPTTSATNVGPLDFNFGGQRATTALNNIDIGNLVRSKTFLFISQAHADESPIGSCTQDRPRIAHGVKSLKDDKEYSTSDYLPGVYNSSWTDKVNGHLIALTNVAVLRDGGSPARNPKLLVFRDYKGDSTATPNYSGAPEVNTYQGDKALLYRVFNSGPIRCMDIVIPNDKPREAPHSALYYLYANELYAVAFDPKLARK